MHKLLGERTATHLMRWSSQLLIFRVWPLRYLPIICPSVKDLLTMLYTADLLSHISLRIAHFGYIPLVIKSRFRAFLCEWQDAFLHFNVCQVNNISTKNIMDCWYWNKFGAYRFHFSHSHEKVTVTQVYVVTGSSDMKNINMRLLLMVVLNFCTRLYFDIMLVSITRNVKCNAMWHSDSKWLGLSLVCRL